MGGLRQDITAPATKLTANTASVNWIKLLRARSPSARYSPGAIVLGFIESANPIETTIPNKRSTMRFLSDLAQLVASDIRFDAYGPRIARRYLRNQGAFASSSDRRGG